MLTASFQEILEQPDLGKKYPEVDPSVMGHRVGKHIIFYRIEPSDDLVILRILHQRMDLKSHLEKLGFAQHSICKSMAEVLPFN